ncbi:MAG TPA: metallopeptidase family protein [Caulobacteraceae bacterium]|nr:metallopeptidase family protein [Caulobacteraceae bacterium]
MMSRWTEALAPSLDDIADIAQAAFETLPPHLRALAGEVVFQISDFAEEEVLEALGIENPFELTGLYQGVDLSRQSVMDPQRMPPMVFLYRRPILDEWTELGDVTLGELVAHVLIHEIGHHFGLSDEAIAAIEASV